MQTGVGVDLVEIQRIEKSLASPHFLSRVFGEEEIMQYRSRGSGASFLAASFCAKEAFAKALGTGLRGFKLREVQVLRDELGKPFFHLSGSALDLARTSGLEFAVSLSHTKNYAVAFVVATPIQ